ncbi:MAG: hypothetical protein WBN38_09070 [Polyangiales bacterium]|jgi:hypothetical protein
MRTPARYVETGAAFMQLTPPHCELATSNRSLPEPFDVVLDGGVQSGLSVAYDLAKRGFDFVVIDDTERIRDPAGSANAPRRGRTSAVG